MRSSAEQPFRQPAGFLDGFRLADEGVAASRRKGRPFSSPYQEAFAFLPDLRDDVAVIVFDEFRFQSVLRSRRIRLFGGTAASRSTWRILSQTVTVEAQHNGVYPSQPWTSSSRARAHRIHSRSAPPSSFRAQRARRACARAASISPRAAWISARSLRQPE